MSAISAKALSDFSYALELYGVCNACHKKERMDLVKAAMALGWSFPINQLNTKLRCDGCGSTDCGVELLWTGADH